MLYTVFSHGYCIGKYDSLDKAKLACLHDFEKSEKSAASYDVKVYNPEKNRVTRTHYARCSYDFFAGAKFSYIFLDYGK